MRDLPANGLEPLLCRLHYYLSVSRNSGLYSFVACRDVVSFINPLTPTISPFINPQTPTISVNRRKDYTNYHISRSKENTSLVTPTPFLSTPKRHDFDLREPSSRPGPLPQFSLSPTFAPLQFE
nr:hypothetical protein BgiMline_022038 [Biomphalaria glabrata]